MSLWQLRHGTVLVSSSNALNVDVSRIGPHACKQSSMQIFQFKPTEPVPFFKDECTLLSAVMFTIAHIAIKVLCTGQGATSGVQLDESNIDALS